MLAVRTAGMVLPLLMLVPSPAPAQDAAAGAVQFKARCAICHSVADGQKAMLAPNLAHLAGRKAASTQFNYSPALKASGLSWDKATLDRFLAAPMKAVPGTRMVVSVADARQRSNIVAYLSTLK